MGFPAELRQLMSGFRIGSKSAHSPPPFLQIISPFAGLHEHLPRPAARERAQCAEQCAQQPGGPQQMLALYAHEELADFGGEHPAVGAVREPSRAEPQQKPAQKSPGQRAPSIPGEQPARKGGNGREAPPRQPEAAQIAQQKNEKEGVECVFHRN